MPAERDRVELNQERDGGSELSDQKYRLVTRSDFDGLVCAVVLKQLDMIDDIKFVHPKDM